MDAPVIIPKKVTLGTRGVEWPSEYLQPLNDSTNDAANIAVLRKRLKHDGYLFLRNILDREVVLDAKTAVLKYMSDIQENEQRQIFDPRKPWLQGVLDHRCGRGCVPFMEGKNSITHSDAVLSVLESPRLFRFFGTFFETTPRTFDFKWLRAMYRDGFTGAHVDNVYMSRGTDKVVTVWIPFGDIPAEMGTLAICEGSHRLAGFESFQQRYGNCDIEAVNLLGTGWFTLDPYEITEKFGGQWKTADFKAGDLLMFTLRTVHMSTVNETSFARISADCRWQPSNEAMDSRFAEAEEMKAAAKGIYGAWVTDEEAADSDRVTMAKLRANWQL